MSVNSRSDNDLSNNAQYFQTAWNEEIASEATFARPMGSLRRRKAAIALTAIWSGTIVLHWISWSLWIVLGLTSLMGIHAWRVLRVRSRDRLFSATADGASELGDFPRIALLVAAKDEEATIAQTIEQLCGLDYPRDRYEVLAIDDCSSDGTLTILKQLERQYDCLRIVRRSAHAGGGKSGALNLALRLSRSDIVAVFDADARVPSDVLKRVVPRFRCDRVGAVQMRKAISNSSVNFWTRAQSAEMALDAFFQQQRIALGGIGELRGNGQFIRRTALDRCGRFNEDTITDDLDLTIRLHLDGWDIDFLSVPAVEEEGVTGAIALWHQRSRWAEGGYQRYFDYWRALVRNPMGTRKTIDLLAFMMTQYVLPTAAVPDSLMAMARSRLPLLAPMTGVAIAMSLCGMMAGLRRIRQLETGDRGGFFALAGQTLRGTLYMMHWLAVMAATTARVAVRPKRLKWVKTVHRGDEEMKR